MLIADGVRKSFGGLRALDEVSIAVELGEVVGLVGPNGSGKSTFLNVLSGFIRPDAGSITLDGINIAGSAPWDVAARGLRRTFQLAAQPERMSTMELMLTGCNAPYGASVLGALLRPRAVRVEEKAMLDKAWELLERLRLGEYANHPAGRLSGGQQKLLSLGVALMSDPKILLLDEPAAGVNPTLRTQMAVHLRDLHAGGMTIVIIEHDMRFIADTCDRVYVLDKGAILTACRPHELADNPEVLRAYLGHSTLPSRVQHRETS